MPKKDLTAAQKAAQTRRERVASMSSAEREELDAKRKKTARKAVETRKRREAARGGSGTPDRQVNTEDLMLREEIRKLVRDELRRIVREEIQTAFSQTE